MSLHSQVVVTNNRTASFHASRMKDSLSVSIVVALQIMCEIDVALEVLFTILQSTECGPLNQCISIYIYTHGIIMIHGNPFPSTACFLWEVPEFQGNASQFWFQSGPWSAWRSCKHPSSRRSLVKNPRSKGQMFGG